MRYRVLPYRTGSKSAKALAEALGGKVLKLSGSSYFQQAEDVIVNWGNINPAHVPEMLLTSVPGSYRLLNPCAAIRPASNKKLFFQSITESGLHDIIPRFWTSAAEIPDDAFPIVCRTILAGHSGAGIVIANIRDQLVPAPLYVQYVKKKHEYRVHVGRRFEPGDGDHSDVQPGMQTVVIDVQQKKRRKEHETPNWQIRNHHNGFIYARQDVAPPPCVTDAAKAAFRATDLDFGAVDVIWNEQENKAYVLEINTAPGLEGQTIDNYVKFFRSI